MVEGGILQYLSNSAAEHKAILLHCPVAAEGDGLMWSSHVQASIMVNVTIVSFGVCYMWLCADDFFLLLGIIIL